MNKFPVNRTWNLNEKRQNAYYSYRQISLSLLTAYSVNNGKSYVSQMYNFGNDIYNEIPTKQLKCESTN